MPNLVLEVGTEEMPAGAIASALEQLRASVAEGLAAARLAPREVLTCGTPRRLIVHVVDVPERQPDAMREVRGPSRSVAYGTDGTPTGAAQGFARKQGVPVDSLEVVSTDQGEYVLARVTDLGRPAIEVLGAALERAVNDLFFPKMMRWGDASPRFVRPVRWVVALLGDAVVPMTIAGVASGAVSRGHRFLAPQDFQVSDADDLLPRLPGAFVQPDPAVRRESIVAQAESLAAEIGGTVPWDEGLLDENNWLVEWPTALRGAFSPGYLALPRPVLVTAMKKHQRFFPVQDAAGKLLPAFVSIRNGGSEHLDTVRAGNERVLTARFADAAYFYEQDRQTPLGDLAPRLDRLQFQEKLGTVGQKRRRLMFLVEALAQSLELDAAATSMAVRAADLAKCDLVSRMVVELPSLQGTIGSEYAAQAGEPHKVADAIAEQYMPRTASDVLPQTALGKMLAVADRIDTLVGYIGIGVLPTGSSDPYGLRRAAHGVVQILALEPDACPLVSIELHAAKAYDEVNGLDLPLDPLCNDLQALFDQRLTAYLQERGIRYDLVDAALSGGPLPTTLVYAIVKRADTLQALATDPAFEAVTQAAARVASILRSAGRGAGPPVPGKEGLHGASRTGVERAVSVLESTLRVVEAHHLTEAAEKSLYAAAAAVLPVAARRAAEYDFAGIYNALEALTDPVNAFFDAVLVMADDRAVRANRLALLEFVDLLYKSLADFTKIVQ